MLKITEWAKNPGTNDMIELVDVEAVFLQIEEELPPLPLTSEGSDGDSPNDGGELQALKKALCDVETSRDALEVEVTRLTAEVERLSKRCKELWSLNCSQIAEFDELLSAKVEEIATLRQLGGQCATAVWESSQLAGPRPVHHRKGKAPPAPVDRFSGDDPTLQFEDWLPGLQRAADWYAWTEAEHLLQLAGHLRGQALQNGTYWIAII